MSTNIYSEYSLRLCKIIAIYIYIKSEKKRVCEKKKKGMKEIGTRNNCVIPHQSLHGSRINSPNAIYRG